MKYIVHSQKLRENKIEIFYTIKDDNGKVIKGNQRRFVGEKKLYTTKLATFMANVMDEIENTPPPPEPEKTFTESEINQILFDKGYPEKKRSLDTLPDYQAVIKEIG